MSSEAVSSEAVSSEAVNTEAVSTQAVSTEASSVEPVAIEFANTRRARRGAAVELLPDDEALITWVRENLDRDLTGRLGPGDRERFLSLRDAVRAVAVAISDEQQEPADAVARLNATAAAAPAWLELLDGRVVQRTAAGAEVDATLAALAACAIEVFGGAQREQVRACGRWPRCVRFFVKNHPRRGYCSPSCANRARAMRHHDRHKDDHKGDPQHDHKDDD